MLVLYFFQLHTNGDWNTPVLLIHLGIEHNPECTARRCPEGVEDDALNLHLLVAILRPDPAPLAGTIVPRPLREVDEILEN